MSSILYSTSLITLVFVGASIADQETQRQGAQDAASNLKLVGPRDLPGDDVFVDLEPRFRGGGPNWSPKGATVPLKPTVDGLEGTFRLGSADHAGNRPIRVVLSRTDPDAAAFDRLSIDADRNGRFSQEELFEAEPTTRKGAIQSFWSASISLEVSQPDGSPRVLSYPIRLWFVVDPAEVDARPALRWTRSGWMQGQAELDGEVVEIALAEGVLDGVYDEADGWTLSRTPDGIRGTTMSYRAGSDHVWIGDRAWRIASMHPSGLQITLRRFDPGHTRLEEMRIRDQYAADRRAPRAGQPLAFSHDFTEAEAEAKRQGRPLFIDFETTWCGPCKTMNALVYTARPVSDAALASELVAVKVDGDEHPDVVKRFGVNAYPTMILLDAQGREIRRAVGYQGVAAMYDFLTVTPTNEQHELPKPEASATDIETLWYAFQIAIQEGEFEAADVTIQRILAADAQGGLGTVGPEAGMALLKLAQHHKDNEAHDLALDRFRLVETVPGLELIGLLRQSQVLVDQKKYRDAADTLERALRIEENEELRAFLERVREMARQ